MRTTGLALIAVAALGAVAVAGAAGGPAGADVPPEPESSVAAVAGLPAGARYRIDPGAAATVAAWRLTPAGVLQSGIPKSGPSAAAGSTPAPGTRRLWPALDQVQGRVYLKEFPLRGVGSNIE